jgi:aryl-alcohol dehydrogenase-like predicted oxidoreductase
MWDYHTPIEELMEGLNTAVQSGKAGGLYLTGCTRGY